MRARIFLALALLLLGAAGATAAPRTPSALVNGSGHLAQVAEMGPVRLTWDVRALGAAGVRVTVRRWPLRGPDAPPDREWRFSSPVGPGDVRFDHLPRAIYCVVAIALDAGGGEIGSESLPVFVEYGGWRAWNGVRQDVDLRAGAPPLAGVGGSYVPAEELPRVDLSPATAVLGPNKEIELRAVVRNMPEGTDVEWELEGPGDLERLPDRRAKYTAPEEESNQIARIRCYVPDTGAAEGRATVLVTPVQVGDE